MLPGVPPLRGVGRRPVSPAGIALHPDLGHIVVLQQDPDLLPLQQVLLLPDHRLLFQQDEILPAEIMGPAAGGDH